MRTTASAATNEIDTKTETDPVCGMKVDPNIGKP